ncbi:MAG: alpha/beta fold hydrolase [Elusimicrobia bacterium]|nr:alpha/beta fold hydrolase [Elusimicrobiota bacterium]
MTTNEILIWIPFSFLAVLLFAVYLSYKKRDAILNPPNRRSPVNVTPENFKLPYETVFFNSADSVELNGWFIPSQNGESSKTIIFCHGWASNKGELLKDTWFLAEKGFNLFYFDFRGCGESKDAGISSVGYLETRDLDGAVKFIKSARSQYASEIYLYGCSMGGSVAVYHAAHNKDIKAVLAESVFYSFDSVIRNWSWKRLKVPYFPMVKMTLFFVKRKLKVDANLYSPVLNVGKISAPILFINGDNDDLVSQEEAQKLFELCSSPKKDIWIVKGASHAKCPETAGMHFMQKVSDFFSAA